MNIKLLFIYYPFDVHYCFRNYQPGAISAGKRVILDLGRVVSTAEVHVNGEKVGLKMHSPWRFDISQYVKSGNNRIEVLVHNTAGNHYLSIPTQYRGQRKLV